MKNLSTTVAVYDDVSTAEVDYAAIEAEAAAGNIDLADAALVTNDGEGTTAMKRQSHHGWGKGAVAGAVVGLLFPPTLLAGAVVGGAGGGLIARMNRSFDRGDIKDLGEVMDAGQVALVVITSQATADAASDLLKGAKKKATKESSTAEDVMSALSAAS